MKQTGKTHLRNRRREGGGAYGVVEHVKCVIFRILRYTGAVFKTRKYVFKGVYLLEQRESALNLYGKTGFVALNSVFAAVTNVAEKDFQCFVKNPFF